MRAMITEEEKQDIGDAYYQVGLAKGREEGREEGIGIGEQRKAMEIDRNLLHRGLDMECVCEISGLSEEEVKNL